MEPVITKTSPWSRVALAFAAVAALAVAVLGAPPAAIADTDGTVTWSVRPADASGVDGRSWVERELDAGEAVTEHMAVTNLGSAEVTFALTSADGYFTPAGRFTMRSGGEVSVAAGTWVQAPPTVSVEAGATAVVPFEIRIPDDATPGDHAAGVAASIHSQGASGGTNVGVESRVGFRVMVRVQGEVRPALEVTAEGDYDTSWNPLRAGDAEVRVTLRNTGNVRLDAAGSIAWAGQVVEPLSATRGEVVELLPGDERVLDLAVREVWPLGQATLPLVVESAVILPDGTREPREAIEQSIVVWAMPWPHLLLLLASVLVVGGALWRGKSRRREIEARLRAAREEGRREAQGT